MRERMSEDTCRDGLTIRIWRGPFECPRCGQTDKTLKETAYPEPIAVLGNSAKLRCRICGKEFMVKS